MRLGAITTIVIACLQPGAKLQQVRDAYFKSSASLAAAVRFEHLVDSADESSTPLLICYKGAAEMLKAKYALNPLKKYSHFKTGKKLIEAGLSKDTSCIEARFIRLSIQSNLPRFLGYNQNIAQDSLFISAELNNINDLDLKAKITDYFQELKARED